MTPLDALVAKDAIREQFAQYTLILDGDGIVPRCGIQRFGPALFTEDATFQSIANDRSNLHGPGMGMIGVEAIAARYGGGMTPFPPCAEPAPRPGAGMQALDVLVAKDRIRERLTQYTLLLDGDGVSRPDLRRWAQDLFVENATFQSFGTAGPLFAGLNGRSAIEAHFAKSLPNLIRRHFFVNTAFDDLTPTTAKTRTTGITMYGRTEQGNAPLIPALVETVTHLTWRNSDRGWQIVRAEVR
jgi:hypothetical protein